MTQSSRTPDTVANDQEPQSPGRAVHTPATVSGLVVRPRASTAMSQAPAPKADPEVASTPTPATQTPTTSYTPGSWPAGRKFVYIGTVFTDL